MRIRPGDPNFPQELWGRTLADAMRYFQIMQREFVASRQRESQQQQQRLQGEPPPQQQQQQYYRPQAPQQQQPQLNEATIKGWVTEALQAGLGPVAQISAQTVYQQVRSQFPDWNFYDAEILQAVSNADQRSLMDPGFWRAAYYYAKGEKLSTPGVQQPQYRQMPVPPGFAQQAPNGRDPNGAIRTAPPMPPTNDRPYFSEAPGQAPLAQGSDLLNDPMDEVMAWKFGIPVEEYRAHKGGRIPPIRAPQQQQANGQYPPAPPAPQSPWG